MHTSRESKASSPARVTEDTPYFNSRIHLLANQKLRRNQSRVKSLGGHERTQESQMAAGYERSSLRSFERAHKRSLRNSSQSQAHLQKWTAGTFSEERRSEDPYRQGEDKKVLEVNARQNKDLAQMDQIWVEEGASKFRQGKYIVPQLKREPQVCEDSGKLKKYLVLQQKMPGVWQEEEH
jgi:hypothetical protein